MSDDAFYLLGKIRLLQLLGADIDANGVIAELRVRFPLG